MPLAGECEGLLDRATIKPLGSLFRVLGYDREQVAQKGPLVVGESSGELVLGDNLDRCLVMIAHANMTARALGLEVLLRGAVIGLGQAAAERFCRVACSGGVRNRFVSSSAAL